MEQALEIDGFARCGTQAVETPGGGGLGEQTLRERIQGGAVLALLVFGAA
jgi:hypothetical protein